MLSIGKKGLIEDGYKLQDEAKIGSIFGIGNGYFGIRGSLEELGEVFIQGTYIRGYFDSIVEIPLTFCDNIYMKNYYFDVQKLKEFEHEDSCINVVDPLLVRIYVGDELFLPWHGKVLSWKRYIDFKDGSLVRKVIWKDSNGHRSEFTFRRAASFASNHLILQEVTVRSLNHDLPIRVELGIDTLVKTNGQHKSILEGIENMPSMVKAKFYAGDKYKMRSALEAHYEARGARFVSNGEHDGTYFSTYELEGKEATFSKVTAIYASIDPVPDYVEATKESLLPYEEAYEAHKKAYQEAFSLIDIKIEGNKEIDTLVRYANYQTLIGFDRFDSVHSLSAKNLTSDKYNQFVWWDAEIFQLPFLIANFPEAARHCLEYRFRHLEQAKENARLEGLKGAKYAFCSSVKGDENVWIYARHPFLQIHISGDVAYGAYNYFRSTGDLPFLKEMGLPMMVEILRYFYSRTNFRNGKLHLDNVTGTDEHHPYVNDDAYTSYQVRFLARKAIELADKYGYAIEEEAKEEIHKLCDLYVPRPNKGIIPQFEGYLGLSPTLELAGNGSAKGFQMKASGLYHRSQVIKQPDVLNLYTYLDIDMNERVYEENWHYYYKMCEASSSLTYPVHTISAIDFHDNETFLVNLRKSLTIDIEDIHNCAYQGVHAGCLAGGWYSIYRGVFGFRPKEDALLVDPKFDHPFDRVSFSFLYQGRRIHATLGKDKLTLRNDGEPFKILYRGRKRTLRRFLTIKNPITKE